MEDKTATRNALKENASTPKFEIYEPTDDLEHTIQKDYTISNRREICHFKSLKGCLFRRE